MFTMIAPIRAVAYCTSTHSAQLTAQMPTRSPLAIPRAIKPRANSPTSAPNWAYVQRRPSAMSTNASLSGQASTARRRLRPTVSPRSGASLVPCVYDNSCGTALT